jgi:hypothetical protein
MGNPLLAGSSPWALKASIPFGSDGQLLAVIENTISGTPPASYTLTYLDGPGYGQAQIHAWSGRSGTTVYGADSSDTGADTSPVDAVAAGVTAAAGDDICVIAITDQSEDGTWTVTQPSGMTLRESTVALGEYTTIAVSTQDAVSAGATGTKTTTFTQSGVDMQGWATYVIAMPTAGGGPTPTTINCSVAAIAIVGSSASVNAKHLVDASVAAVAIVGLAATILRPTRVNTTVAAVAIAGSAATINAQTRIACGIGLLSIAGLAATITRPTRINGQTGAVAVVGLPAAIDAQTHIAASVAAVSIAGLQAAIQQAGKINAGVADVAIEGKQATIITPRTIACSVATVAITGQAATVNQTARIAASVAAISITGAAATITQATRINCLAASISIAGASATINQQRLIAVALADVAIEGESATITEGSSGGVGAAAVWNYALSNGMTAEQVVLAVLGYANDLARVHGLIQAEPLVVTPTSRNAGAVSQTIDTAGETVTVTRV